MGSCTLAGVGSSPFLLARMPDVESLDAKIAELTRLRRELANLTGGRGDARAADAARKRKARSLAVDLKARPPKDPERRARCEADTILWLQTYLPDEFDGPFTEQRQEMAYAIERACQYGGDQAIAAPRGEGKTTLVECVTIKAVLEGKVKFPVIVAATGPDAQRILRNIKERLERPDRSGLLAEDYPELDCVHALEGRPQRTGGQTIDGRRSYIRWSGTEIRFPDYPGAQSGGAVIATRGLDAAIRGLRVGNLRPDLVVIDDPETRQSVMSEIQTAARRLAIEQDLAGLGGPGRRLSRVMLTTIMRQECLSAEYTDQKRRSAWKGKRFRFVLQWPERADLWDEYMVLRHADQETGDEYARRAHQFYLDHREQMDAGAEVANPSRYIEDPAPDGTPLEVSALEHAYNIISDRGLEHFLTEYQNDPPAEIGPQESGITAYRVQTQVSGYERKAIPPGCTVLVQAIDCRKVALHFVVRAFQPDSTGYTIDYGVQEVHGTTVGTDEGLDDALKRALRARMEAIRDEPYLDHNGEPMPVALTLVDAGWRTTAIYDFCLEWGALDLRPAMGFGKSAGCTQANFAPPVRTTTDKKTGDGWFLSRRPVQGHAGGIWLVCMDTDRWKAFEHDRWMTSPEKPGCMFNFGQPAPSSDRMSQDQKWHMSYAKHITAEVEVEEVVKGVLVRRWKAKSDTNHYLDASYMTHVAANMKGISTRPKKVQQAVAGGGWFAAQKGR